MTNIEIERAARAVHRLIWEQREKLWAGQTPKPIEMLDPEVACAALGVDYQHFEELPALSRRGKKVVIAGLLDRQAKKIAVSDQFPIEEVRFTGAHEIGHWQLHPQQIMHRDRPIKGVYRDFSMREPEEKEADYFAACFLMPRNLVVKTFQNTFSTSRFIFDDTSAFWLCRGDPESLLRPDVGSKDRALALAGAQSFEQRRFTSLAKQFRVSVGAMAIRLMELNLIED